MFRQSSPTRFGHQGGPARQCSWVSPSVTVCVLYILSLVSHAELPEAGRWRGLSYSSAASPWAGESKWQKMGWGWLFPHAQVTTLADPTTENGTEREVETAAQFFSSSHVVRSWWGEVFPCSNSLYLCWSRSLSGLHCTQTARELLPALKLYTAHWLPYLYILFTDHPITIYCSLTALQLHSALSCLYMLLTDCPMTK